MHLPSIGEFIFSKELNEKLSATGLTKTFAAEDLLMDEDATIRSIPIVLKGSIRVMRTDEDGREILLYYITPGESCIMSFLGGMHHDKSKVRVVAEEETEVLAIPVEKVSQLIKEFPEWLDYIFRLYHKRFEELLQVVNAVAFKNLDERLLAFLKKKAKLTGSSSIHLTHEQLANELASSRVVISRLLKQLEVQGLVKLGRNKIILM